MKIIRIMLNTMEKVKSFIYDMDSVEGEAVIYSDRYYVDAKSFIGIFTLDLTKPLKLRIGNWRTEYDILFQKYMAV